MDHGYHIFGFVVIVILRVDRADGGCRRHLHRPQIPPAQGRADLLRDVIMIAAFYLAFAYFGATAWRLETMSQRLPC